MATLRTMKTPALYFSAPLAFAPADGDALPSRLSGVAYSGGAVHDWGGTVVIDLASTASEPSIPLLHEHQRESVIGTVRSLANDGVTLALDANVFTDIDATAESIARKAQRGLAWQLSIGLFDAEASEIRSGKVAINGQLFTAPLTVLKNGLIREISVVALGADRATNATFFTASRETASPETPTMSDTTEDPARIAALEAQVAGLSEELAAARDALAAADATVAEIQLAARKAAVKTLFSDINRNYSDDTAAHYFSLSDADKSPRPYSQRFSQRALERLRQCGSSNRFFPGERILTRLPPALAAAICPSGRRSA